MATLRTFSEDATKEIAAVIRRARNEPGGRTEGKQLASVIPRPLPACVVRVTSETPDADGYLPGVMSVWDNVAEAFVDYPEEVLIYVE